MSKIKELMVQVEDYRTALQQIVKSPSHAVEIAREALGLDYEDETSDMDELDFEGDEYPMHKEEGGW